MIIPRPEVDPLGAQDALPGEVAQGHAQARNSRGGRYSSSSGELIFAAIVGVGLTRLLGNASLPRLGRRLCQVSARMNEEG
jgi:hypothetical protein